MKKKKCECCGKKIKRRSNKRYCSSVCRDRDYYQKNKKKIRKYQIEYYRNHPKNDLCKCGGKKRINSKRCRKCHISNKFKGQLSRLSSLK